MKFQDYKDSKTFCVYPFIHLATLTDGSIPPCCVGRATNATLTNSSMASAWNSPELKDIRVKMMNNEEVSNCTQCYHDEHAGVSSHRLQSNQTYYNLYKDDLVKSLESTLSDGTITVDPFTLDIRAGNTCNLKCVMCRPNESSKWLPDSKKIMDLTENVELKLDWAIKSNIDTKNFTWVEKEEFWKEFEQLVPNLKEIIFGGGEPFLLKSINSLINYMVETGHSKHIKIRFHTNGTQIPESFWPLVDKFREIEMIFSIDGLDEQNYYVRYPAKWEEVVKNLWLSDQHNAKTMILYSLHSMSMYNLIDLYKWRLEQPFKNVNSIPIVLGRVYNPTYLNPQGLPLSVKEKISKRILDFVDENKSKYESWYFDSLIANVNWIMDSDFSNYDTLIEYIKRLDEVRGTSFEQVYPELHKLLQNASK
jgi:sulfatase maturation enzyme AslB (radical SAM superfamily)